MTGLVVVGRVGWVSAVCNFVFENGRSTRVEDSALRSPIDNSAATWAIGRFFCKLVEIALNTRLCLAMCLVSTDQKTAQSPMKSDSKAPER